MIAEPPIVRAQLQRWLANITQHYGQNGETGVDIGERYGTPVYAITEGDVVGAGVYDGGVVVSIASIINYGGLNVASVYYQHMDDWYVKVGQHVPVGFKIGISGGQLSGGKHPSKPRFSTGPHLEIGLNAPYGGMWHPLGPNINPLPWLNSLLSAGYNPTPAGIAGAGATLASVGSTGGTSGAIGNLMDGITAFAERHVNHTSNDDFGALGLAIDDAETFPPLALLTQSDNLGVVGDIPILGGVATELATIKDTPTRIIGFLWASGEAVALRGFFFASGTFLLLIVAAKLLNDHGATVESQATKLLPLATVG